MSDSEFGKILGFALNGIVVSSEGSSKREDGTVVWVSGAFTSMTSSELRRLADYMDERWKSN